MRCFSWLLGLVLVLSTGVAKADETPQQILDKAIAAHGGEANLTKHPASTWKAKGTVHIQGMEIKYTSDYAQSGGNKFRANIEVDFNGQQIQITAVINGDQGWRKMGDNAAEMTDQEFKSERNSAQASWLARLYPLKDKAYALTPLKEIDIDGKPAVGFNVARQGYGDVKMYFDKQTSMLVKFELMAFDMQSGGEVKQENFPSNYKDVQGVKIPMKLTVKRDGTVFLESETTEYKRVEKLEESLFQKLQ